MMQDIRNDIKDLSVYTDSLKFSNMIWDVCKNWDYFAKKTIGQQIVRSADSISANISEGYGRFHYKENLKFCYYSRGSLEETKDWLRKAFYRELISKEHKENIEIFLENFPKSLNSYIKYIKKCLNEQS